MSVYSMARTAARMRLKKDQAKGDYVAAGAGGGGKVEEEGGAVDRALGTVVDHIPTEIIGAYLAVLALVASNDLTANQVIFWFFLALTPVAVWVAWALKLKASGDKVPIQPDKWPWWPILAAPFAFVVWAIALPNSVVTSFVPGFQTYMATLSLIAMALVLSLGDAIRDYFPGGA